LTPELKQEVLKKVLAAYCPDVTDERVDELMASLEDLDKTYSDPTPPTPPAPPTLPNPDDE
jgi:ribosomal protein L12E/L44/L45/RPP1/RPP2